MLETNLSPSLTNLTPPYEPKPHVMMKGRIAWQTLVFVGVDIPVPILNKVSSRHL